MTNSNHPPRVADWLLFLFDSMDQAPPILGDLREEFSAVASRRGLWSARLCIGGKSRRPSLISSMPSLSRNHGKSLPPSQPVCPCWRWRTCRCTRSFPGTSRLLTGQNRCASPCCASGCASPLCSTFFRRCSSVGLSRERVKGATWLSQSYSVARPSRWESLPPLS